MHTNNKSKSFKIYSWLKYKILSKISFGRLRKHFTQSYKKQNKMLSEIKKIKKISPKTNLLNIILRANTINTELDIKNRLKIPQKKNKTRILYVANSLSTIGGVENRLDKQCKYLSKAGYECLILTATPQECPPLKAYPNLNLIFYAENFSSILIDFVTTEKIDYVEFQAKDIDYLNNIDFNKLNKICIPGLCIHNAIEFETINKNWFRYIIRATSPWATDYIKDVRHIPNWIEKIQPKWKFNNQNKALFISRIDKEKLPTLKSFINACKTIGCNFDIAGPIQYNKSKIQNILINEHSKYLGEINTINFLENKINHYLFIGGVGQVAIEAASYGIPALVCTHYDKYEYSRFVTKKNINDFIFSNFTIKHHPPKDNSGTIQNFIKNINESTLNIYDTTKELEENLSEDIIVKKYISILKNS